MADIYRISGDTLKGVADAIREKTGSTDPIAVEDMPDDIRGITTGSTPVLQEKTATSNGDVLPDEGYDGLSKVTVNVPAPAGPSGTLTINKNDTYDVTDYASVVVAVPTNLEFYDGSFTIE